MTAAPAGRINPNEKPRIHAGLFSLSGHSIPLPLSIRRSGVSMATPFRSCEARNMQLIFGIVDILLSFEDMWPDEKIGYNRCKKNCKSGLIKPSSKNIAESKNIATTMTREQEYLNQYLIQG